MTDVLFAPHNDDETLWASFLVSGYRPVVYTVLRSHIQESAGITYHEREAETHLATTILGASRWEQWEYPDTDPPWETIIDHVRTVASSTGGRAFAPLPEPGGHPDHSSVGEIVQDVFGPDRTCFYATYRYGGPKTRTNNESVPSPPQIALKLRALACYQSQIERGPRRFFMFDLHEYLGP